MHDSRPGRRVAIVGGLRTPFAKSGTVFRDVSATALARHAARELAETLELSVDWRVVDLEGPWPELGRFDAVLVFNYLDRARMPEIRDLVAPRGLLMMESFLTGQRELGWGPASEDHLLRPGELAHLAAPLRILHGREALEPIDAERWRAVASLVAVRDE